MLITWLDIGAELGARDERIGHDIKSVSYGAIL
jgi:hypothetical protein